MPSPFVALVLVLAAYRLTRLAGWDEFPLAAKIRAWVTGEYWVPDGPVGRVDELTVDRQGITVKGTLSEVGRKVVAGEDLEPENPGKPPSSDLGVRPAYSRPVLAHLIHCPFCVGFWISLAVYLFWLVAGSPGEQIHSWLFYPLMPFAISGMVGIISKNLDA